MHIVVAVQHGPASVGENDGSEVLINADIAPEEAHFDDIDALAC